MKRLQHLSYEEKLRGLGLLALEERKFKGDLINEYPKGGCQEDGARPSGAQQQGNRDTNSTTDSSNQAWDETSFLWGWLSTGTGCRERCWGLLPWRYYSKTTWTWSWVMYSRVPCLSKEVGLDDLHRCLPTLTVLWQVIQKFGMIFLYIFTEF